jgi:hypothetical protein
MHRGRSRHFVHVMHDLVILVGAASEGAAYAQPVIPRPSNKREEGIPCHSVASPPGALRILDPLPLFVFLMMTKVGT